MQCPRCQHENVADAAFCGECGARLETVCSGFGESNRSGAKFCRKCGHGLSAIVPSTPSRFDTPQAYTPKHLAAKILTSKAALEGERKQVTVLFADLKGSMELLADRDPEEARKILDPVIERMMEAVHRYEGTVNQVMGDGIMALFGAPLAHEDHAVRACYAALRMQESISQYADGIFRSHGVPLQIRVGLNSGEVVVRAIGSDLHMDYTAVGQTTHLAARMEQMATPGTILLAPATLHLAAGYVQVTARGPVAVKGLAEPVEIYALTGASASRSRLHAAAARGLTRFVGRDAEIEQIRRALALCARGPRPARRPRGGTRRGKVPPRLRVHPLPPHSGLAHPGSGLRVLRQGDQLPAGHRPPQGLLQGPGPRRSPGDSRTSGRQDPDAGPSARAAADAAARAVGCTRRR
jgi:class 3 adenylate cyclase